MATKAELTVEIENLKAANAVLEAALAEATAPTAPEPVEAAPGRKGILAPREARHNPQPGHRI